MKINSLVDFKIKSLELIGYKRLTLNNINHFKIYCEQDVQIILGSNGAGKSSVLFELSPLPAHPSSFRKNGKKIIVIESNSLTYTLVNDFSIHNGNSFKVFDEELNPGGTISVQRQLVEAHFGITNNVRELMTTSLGFHAMSTNTRRQWFTQLNHNNYDYALSVYNNARQKHRDTLGALKIAKKRLVLQTESGTTDIEQNQLRSDVESLHDFISHLIEHRGPKAEHEAQVILSDVHTNEESIKTICQTFNRVRLRLDQKFLGQTTDSLQESKNNKTAQHSILNKTKDEYLLNLDELKSKVQAIELNSKFDTQEISDEKMLLLDQKQTLINSIKIIDDYKKVKEMQNAFSSIYSHLCEFFKDLPQNENQIFSRQKLIDLKSECEQLTNSIKELQGQLNKINSYVSNQEHLKTHNETTCPQCTHKWSVGFNQLLYSEALKKQSEKNFELLDYEKRLEVIKSDIEKTQNYGLKLREYKTIVLSSPALKDLWNYLSNDTQQTLFNNSPSLLIPVIIGFNEELEVCEMINKIDVRIQEIDDLLSVAQRLKDDDTNKVIETNTYLTEKCHLIMLELISLEKEINELNYEITNRKFIEQTSQTLQTLIDQNIGTFDKVKQIYRKNAIDEIIKVAQLQLAQKQTLLSNVNAQKAILIDLEKSIHELQTQEKALSIIVDELSPTDGLIALGMTGFIKMFVSQMNKIIKQIWTYPLVVEPCQIEDDGSGELNYKFPILVGEEKEPAPDVMFGSTGIREIIDFAFKITALTNMKLTNSPIYLDELGGNMDTVHKIKVIEFIKQMSQINMFSQIFMISHDIVHYGALPNAQICVICEANITLPKNCVFNKHVILN